MHKIGVVITKYDDPVHNTVKFDSSKYDYGYDDDTFPSDAATDFDEIVKDCRKMALVSIEEVDLQRQKNLMLLYHRTDISSK